MCTSYDKYIFGIIWYVINGFIFRLGQSAWSLPRVRHGPEDLECALHDGFWIAVSYITRRDEPWSLARVVSYFSRSLSSGRRPGVPKLLVSDSQDDRSSYSVPRNVREAPVPRYPRSVPEDPDSAGTSSILVPIRSLRWAEDRDAVIARYEYIHSSVNPHYYRKTKTKLLSEKYLPILNLYFLILCLPFPFLFFLLNSFIRA